MKRKFFTPSMGVACLALAVALSGTAYGVSRLPANSVGTKQVINRSLQGVDFDEGRCCEAQLASGRPKGATGPRESQGESGTVSTDRTAGRSRRPPVSLPRSARFARPGRGRSTAASRRASRFTFSRPTPPPEVIGWRASSRPASASHVVRLLGLCEGHLTDERRFIAGFLSRETG